MQRRINVDSGRPLEAKAQYSRAIRVNDLVLQSGTTAIDLSGDILGDNVVDQTAAIFDIAKGSIGAAEGCFEDVVRVRAFIVGRENIRPAADAIVEHFGDQHFVVTFIPTSQLARPTQLIEIEIEAIDDARKKATFSTHEAENNVAISSIKIGKRIFFSGVEIFAGSANSQTTLTVDSILGSLENVGAAREDLTSLRIFVSDRNLAPSVMQDVTNALAGVQPVVSVMEVSSFERPGASVMIEAEAYAGAAAGKQTIVHPRYPQFAQALVIEEQIFLSNIEPLDANFAVLKPNDWGAQRDLCIEKLQSVLEAVDGSLDDVINRRYFTYVDVEQNRGYGDGRAWFEATRPAALGCRIANHMQDGTALTLEAHAIRGAGENIEWRQLTP